MKDAILSSIDSAGRLVIPKAIREAAGLRPDTPLELRVHDGRVEIEPAPLEVRIETRRGVAVAVPVQPVAAVSTEEVEAIRRRIREEREDRAL
ncbi:MAG TPA: AbrB/MazE/SpoVT family DNA-binding domain-containing protein [Thermoanaerobaculia bacterium]|nr:AbrB/MazE/SpoVT family DNA-binding domain-containing protein [Thermoanaerobaculia bacterium]